MPCWVIWICYTCVWVLICKRPDRMIMFLIVTYHVWVWVCKPFSMYSSESREEFDWQLCDCFVSRGSQEIFFWSFYLFIYFTHPAFKSIKAVIRNIVAKRVSFLPLICIKWNEIHPRCVQFERFMRSQRKLHQRAEQSIKTQFTHNHLLKLFTLYCSCLQSGIFAVHCGLFLLWGSTRSWTSSDKLFKKYTNKPKHKLWNFLSGNWYLFPLYCWSSK